MVVNRVKVYPIVLGWCTSAGLGGDQSASQECGTSAIELSSGGGNPFDEIAEETGGHMFYVSSGDVAPATDIILKEMEANADLSVVRGVMEGGSRIYYVPADGTMDSLNFLLNSADSTGLELTIRRPTGSEVLPTDSGVSMLSTERSTYYSISPVMVGMWQAEVQGSGSYAFSSSAPTSIEFRYLSSTVLEPGSSHLVTAYLGGSDLSSLQFVLVNQVGGTEIPVSMSDSGNDGDTIADDGIYSGYLSCDDEGEYNLKVSGLCGGVGFSRVDTVLISIESSPLETYVPVVTKRARMGHGFESQFNGSAPGWEVHAGTWGVDSRYYWTEGLDSRVSSTSYRENFADLVYEARVFRDGCLGCANRLYVRGVPEPLGSGLNWDKAYLFQYTNNGYFSVWHIDGDTASALQNWAECSAVSKGGWNALRAVANRGSLSFYINDVPVWTGSDDSFSSGRVGLGMYRDADSTGDLFRADWAKLTTSGGLALEGGVMGQVGLDQRALNERANRLGAGSANRDPQGDR